MNIMDIVKKGSNLWFMKDREAIMSILAKKRIIFTPLESPALLTGFILSFFAVIFTLLTVTAADVLAMGAYGHGGLKQIVKRHLPRGLKKDQPG